VFTYKYDDSPLERAIAELVNLKAKAEERAKEREAEQPTPEDLKILEPRVLQVDRQYLPGMAANGRVWRFRQSARMNDAACCLYQSKQLIKREEFNRLVLVAEYVDNE